MIMTRAVDIRSQAVSPVSIDRTFLPMVQEPVLGGSYREG